MLCASGFVDDVIFSHNGASEPELNTTRMFRLVCQAVAPVGHQTTLFGLLYQCGGTGDDVYRLRLHLVAFCGWKNRLSSIVGVAVS